MIYTSGQLPTRGGELLAVGKVGAEVSAELATECARVAVLNAVAAVAAEAGGIDHIDRIVKVTVFVASAPGLHGSTAGGQRRQRAPRRDLRRCRTTRPKRRRRGRAPAGCADRDRADRRSDRPTERATRLASRSRPVPTNSADILRRLAPEVPRGTGRSRRRLGSGVAGRGIALPAASVILLRESRRRLETYLLHRHARMAFAASMVVFPGGRMDPVDEGAARSVARLRRTGDRSRRPASR